MQSSAAAEKADRGGGVPFWLRLGVLAAVLAGVIWWGFFRPGWSLLRQQCVDCGVVLITADTLRPDRMSAYGYGRETTPRLTRFFEEGIVYEDAVASAPCTIPSIQQLIRGAVDPDQPTLAQRMKRLGFSTGAVVSQHHLAREPDLYRAGFDHWDVQSPDELDRHGMSARGADEVTERGIAWLAENGDGRFFLWLHYFDPHDPYRPPEPYRNYAPPGSVAADGDRRLVQERVGKETNRNYRFVDDIFSDTDRERLRGLYDGEVRYLDDSLGRLFDALSELNLLHRTLVVFTADHGERLGEEGVWDHCLSLSEVELKVPLMMRLPGWEPPAGGVVRERVSTLDIVPAILALQGSPCPDCETEPSRLLVSESGRAVVSSWAGIVELSDGRWKLQARCAEEECIPLRLSVRAGPGPTASEQQVERARLRLTEELAESSERLRALGRGTQAAEVELQELGYTE